MLNLRSIVPYMVVASDNPALLQDSIRVIQYCKSFARWGNSVIFTATEPIDPPDGIHFYQIPHSDPPYGKAFQTFLTKSLPMILVSLGSPHYMWMHDDGFPTHPELWTPDFLLYDWIGPAWHDAVGGSAVSLRSEKMLMEMSRLPWFTEGNDDDFVCRKHHDHLSEIGIKFAPIHVADQYCSETRHQPSFAFHGRHFNPEGYKGGWNKIIEYENARPNRD